MSQGTETHFSVILPVVFSFQHGMGKNEGGIGKVYPVCIEVLAPFLFIRSRTWPLRIMFRDLPPTVRMV
jgi:hypothetical protein